MNPIVEERTFYGSYFIRDKMGNEIELFHCNNISQEVFKNVCDKAIYYMKLSNIEITVENLSIKLCEDYCYHRKLDDTEIASFMI
jgi:hypothetical protein